jgi:SAM-dependent methyltransferase
MLEYLSKRVEGIENLIASQSGVSREDCLRELRGIGLTNFGDLLFSMPRPEWPTLSGILPTMASPEVQRSWTGADGKALLQQSLDFVMTASANYTNCTGRSLQDASILDFGCGYGRLLRLFLFFTSELNLYGVDPLQDSLNECTRNGLQTNLYLSEFLPTELPFPQRTFDFIYSFSVFTHLNEQAAIQCLHTLSRYLTAKSLLVITIRPVEFWLAQSHVSGFLDANNIDRQSLIDRHRNGEFVYISSGGVGHETYGDSSFDLGWIDRNLSQYRIAFVDQSLSDTMQLYVGLMKK